jgi:hypothetical protein
MLTRNRQASGARNGQAILTTEQVRDIRQLAQEHDLRGNVNWIASVYGI